MTLCRHGSAAFVEAFFQLLESPLVLEENVVEVGPGGGHKSTARRHRSRHVALHAPISVCWLLPYRDDSYLTMHTLLLHLHRFTELHPNACACVPKKRRALRAACHGLTAIMGIVANCRSSSIRLALHMIYSYAFVEFTQGQAKNGF